MKWTLILPSLAFDTAMVYGLFNYLSVATGPSAQVMALFLVAGIISIISNTVIMFKYL